MIESVNNNKIKEYSKLNMRKYRENTGLFIVEGEHLVEEAIKNNLVEVIYSTIDYKDAILVTPEVMAKLSDLKTPPRVLAICKKIKEKDINGNILVLDDIQDPGNLGTIIRSAVAFNIDTIVASSNTVDIYNIKTIRATEGMLFNINYIKRDLLEFIPTIKDSYKIITTDVNDGIDIKLFECKNNYAIIVGNEGNGVRPEIANMCDSKINIKMNPLCESLNVGVATSIILHQLNK